LKTQRFCRSRGYVYPKLHPNGHYHNLLLLLQPWELTATLRQAVPGLKVKKLTLSGQDSEVQLALVISQETILQAVSMRQVVAHAKYSLL